MPRFAEETSSYYTEILQSLSTQGAIPILLTKNSSNLPLLELRTTELRLNGITLNMNTGAGTGGGNINMDGGTITGVSIAATGGNFTGSVSIGGSLTVNNNAAIVGDLNSSTFGLISGTGLSRSYVVNRTVPTIVNNAVDIGSFAVDSGAISFEIMTVVSASGFSVAKNYNFAVQYAQNSSTWEIARPLSDTGPYGTNDFEIDVNVGNGTASLRLRRTVASTAGSAVIFIKATSITSNFAFTPSTSVASVAAPTAYLKTAIAGTSNGVFNVNGDTTINGNLKIGTSGGIIYGFDSQHSIALRAGGQDITRISEYGGTLAAGKGIFLNVNFADRMQIASDAVAILVPLQVTGTTTSTSFSGIGTALTSLNAVNITIGTIATARLGSGTANSTTYLRGDQTWASLPVGVQTLDDLTDVVITSAVANNFIQYNGTNWVNVVAPTIDRPNIVSTPTDGITLTNSVASSSGTTVQMSPRVSWIGTAWKTSGSISDTHLYTTDVLPITGVTQTTSNWRLRSSSPMTGGFIDLLYVSNVGLITAVQSAGFAGVGTNLTALNGSNIASGTVAAARLGSGTTDATTFLRGDNTWQPVPNNHVQNTDVGTNSSTFQIGISTGPKLKNVSGTLSVRNAADTADAPFSAGGATFSSDMYVSGVGNFQGSGGGINVNGGFVVNNSGAITSSYSLATTNGATIGTSLTVGTTVTMPNYADVGNRLMITDVAGNLIPTTTIPVANGSAVTNLNASNLATGTVPVARLGSGTATVNTVLLGNNTWSGTPTITSLVASQIVTTTPTDGLFLQNPTAATSSFPSLLSPALHWRGSAWATTISAAISADYIADVLPISGTTGITSLWRLKLGTTNLLTVSDQGIITAGGSVNAGFVGVGTSLTSLNGSNITIGTIAVARLAASGTPTSNTVLLGNSSWSSGPTLVSLSVNQTLGTTSTDGFAALNLTAATSGVPVQISPRLRFGGNAWDTGASASVTHSFIIEDAPTSGNPTIGYLRIGYSNGGAFTYPVTISGTGVITADGSGLTNLVATNLTSGLVATARLGSGTANSTTYLRGDQTWAAVPSSSIASLTDVTLTSLTSGQYLRYNGSAWINTTDGSTFTLLNASNLGSGTVPVARLGSGTPTVNTVLLGNNTWSDVPTLTSLTATTVTSSQTGLVTTPTDGIVLVNNTAATSAVPVQISPRLRLRGYAWFPGSSTNFSVDWTLDALPVSNNPPSGTLRFSYGGNGGATSSIMTLTSSGILTTTGFSGNGSSLTTLNASNLSSGTVATARLGSGTANSTTYLRGDSTWAAVPSSSISTLTDVTLTSLSSGQYLKYNGTAWINVSDIQAGTITANTQFFGIGTNITSLSANNLGSGTVPLARLGSSGTASTSTFLRGDNTWSNTLAGNLTVSSGGITYTGGLSGDTGTFSSNVTINNSNLSLNNTNIYLANNYGLLGWNTITSTSKNTFYQLNGQIYLGDSSWSQLNFLGAGGTITFNSSGVFAAPSFSGIGSSLTALNASNLTTGTVATARLGSGTADATTYLRGDGTWATPTGGGGGSGSAYATTFNATTDWGTASGGKYTITVTHNLNSYNCTVGIWDETSGKLQTFVGDVAMTSVNVATISVPQTPDGRFAGRVVVLASGAGTGSAAYLSASNIFTNTNKFTLSSGTTVPLTIEQVNSSGSHVNFKGSGIAGAYDAYYPSYTIPIQINDSTLGPNTSTQLFLLAHEGGCFLEGTPVSTPDGTRAIETLKAGDEVISMDEESRFTFVNQVKELLVHHPHKPGYLVVNEQLKVTPNHKIYVNDQWMPIGEAKIGDYLINSQGKKVWIYSIEEFPDKITSYNIKVKEAAKNYFANDLLVHNKCPFLYVFDKGKWIYQNTFLYEIDSPEKETIQRRKLRNLTNEFVIREIEPETSYIKNLSLIAITPNGEVKLKWTNRVNNLITNHRDYVKVQFEKLPVDTTELYIEAEGYYIWKGD